MTYETLRCRTSVLIARADACADGFDRIGKTFSAGLTRDMAKACRSMPDTAPLYEHWIGEQETRLAGMEARP